MCYFLSVSQTTSYLNEHVLVRIRYNHTTICFRCNVSRCESTSQCLVKVIWRNLVE